MPFCNNCGTETPEGARFCQNCGAEVGIPQPVTEPAPPAALSSPPPPIMPGQSYGAAGAPPVVSPYYAYPPPPYAVVPGQPVPTRPNGKAVAGMWLGIVSVFPGAIFNWIGIVIGITGLIFSVIGLNEVRARAASPYLPPQAGRTQARAGLILSIVGIILSTIVLIYILNNLDKYGIKLTR